MATFSHLLSQPTGGLVAGGTGRERIPRFAFHARFPGLVDESRYAEMAARQASLTMVYSTPQEGAATDTLAQVLRVQGEPFASSSIYAQFRVMESAHLAGLKVLLDGQGGDEVCGGYTYFLGVRAAGLLRSGRPLETARELRGQVQRGSMGTIGAFASAGRGILSDPVNERLRRIGRGRWGIQVGDGLRHAETLHREHHLPGTLLARRLWQDLASDSLPALLRYEDRNSMAFGIETRVPFLDYRLVELAVRLPDRLRVNRGLTKVVLRRAMTHRVPKAILDRRDKLGFATPQGRWLDDSRDQIATRLRHGQVVARGWIAPAEIERLLASRTRADRDGAQLWRAYILEEWLRTLWPDGRP